MNSDNSAAMILRNVIPCTTVLEFGADNGYMTQYMKETLKCKVSIVEMDYDNGLQALGYADQFLIGENDGDIENYQWLDTFQKNKYNHIIFADVLEHLYDPHKVLKSATELLAYNGSILISIPNVSHNGVIIDLINDNFQYRELGLLDSTHLRFFTRRTLAKMVDDAGLYISQEMNTRCAVEHAEFGNSFADVSIEMEKILRSRLDGNIYQFVWELKLK